MSQEGGQAGKRRGGRQWAVATRRPGAAAGAAAGPGEAAAAISLPTAELRGGGQGRAGPGGARRAAFLFCLRSFWAGRGRGPSSWLRLGCPAAVVRGRGLGGQPARPSDRGASDPSWPAGPRGVPEGEGEVVCGQKCPAALTSWRWDGVLRAGTSLPDSFKFLPLPSS